MAIKPDYMVGTVSVAASGTVVTGVGTQWMSADIKPGDTLKVKNLDAIIASVDTNTSITLKEPWTGGVLSGSEYAIRYQPDGSRFTAAVRTLVEQINAFTPSALSLLQRYENRSIFVYVTGQSNATSHQPHSWIAPKNLLVWNYNFTQGNVGTAFVIPDGTMMSLAMGIGKRLAEQNPDKLVFIVNIALSGNTIKGWLPDAPVGKDVYADTIANMPLALAAAGRSTIDEMHWRQGEADRSAGLSAVYPSEFETVVTRFRTNSWFQASTPIIVHGVVSSAIAGDSSYGPMNKTLQKVVNADPERRKFFYSAAIPYEFWTDTPRIHMTGAGYEQAGALAADVSRGRTNGIQQPFIVDTDNGGVIDPEKKNFTPVITGGTSAGTGSYSNQTGWIREIGKRVDFSVNVTWSAHTGTGSLFIDGFQVASDNERYPCAINSSGVTYSGQLYASIINSGGFARIQFTVQPPSGGNAIVLPIEAAGQLTVSGMFYKP